MIRLIIVLGLLGISGCATMGGRLAECRNLCQGEKVDFFKDDVLECQCQSKIGE